MTPELDVDPAMVVQADALPPVPAAPALPGAPVAPPESPSPLLAWLRSAWRKLTTPTHRRPEDYSGKLLARLVNQGLDQAEEGPAHRAQLGESVDLVRDHLMGGHGGLGTPLGYLAGSTWEYAGERWVQARREAEPGAGIGSDQAAQVAA